MKCVEMYDGIPFCRSRYNYDGVHQEYWHFASFGRTEQESLDSLSEADCPECLRRIAALGEAAWKRLAVLAGAK